MIWGLKLGIANAIEIETRKVLYMNVCNYIITIHLCLRKVHIPTTLTKKYSATGN